MLSCFNKSSCSPNFFYNFSGRTATSPESSLHPFYSFYSLSCRTVCSCMSATSLPCSPAEGNLWESLLMAEGILPKAVKVRGKQCLIKSRCWIQRNHRKQFFNYFYAYIYIFMNCKKKFSILEKLQSTFLERFTNSHQVFSQKSRNLTSLGAKIIGLLCVFAENNIELYYFVLCMGGLVGG